MNFVTKRPIKLCLQVRPWLCEKIFIPHARGKRSTLSTYVLIYGYHPKKLVYPPNFKTIFDVFYICQKCLINY